MKSPHKKSLRKNIFVPFTRNLFEKNLFMKNPFTRSLCERNLLKTPVIRKSTIGIFRMVEKHSCSVISLVYLPVVLG